MILKNEIFLKGSEGLYNNSEVQLSFCFQPFTPNPRHVLVIPYYKGYWVLTKHPRRGLEFPGGKVERGETPIQAAIREVYEEIGAIVDTIQYIGQYQVNESKGDTTPFHKNIYFSEIKKLIEDAPTFETEGAFLFEELPIDYQVSPNFSFIMKDSVVQESLKEIARRRLVKK